MKIRNKKTGEIIKIIDIIFDNDRLFFRVEDEIGTFKKEIKSFKLLNEEWEDYEEPKEYYWVRSGLGDICKTVEGFSPHDEYRKQIGNYFETKEEAERAVEKLKAWKRLKDGGFTIRQWRHTPDMTLTTGSFINIKGFIPEVVKNMKDLDLLFGGEE